MESVIAIVDFSVNNNKSKIIRRDGDFHPSVWGDHFIESTSADSKPNIWSEQRFEELKQEVKRMISVVAAEPLQEMNMIDILEKLGVAYHFEEEIEETLQRIYDSQINQDGDGDLYYVSLQFRLLRQQGYNLSTDVFNKFKDDEGNFRVTLTCDIKGMLSLYEAAHLSIPGEIILDEALAFTIPNLKAVVTHLNSPLAIEVKHALELPFRKSIPRLEARHYISIYQEEEARNELLLEFAKLDFNRVQYLHQIEIREISRWWKDIEIASKLPFVRDRLVECYFWTIGVYYEPQYSLGRILMAKLTSMVSILDDIYDVYGTLEELELLTNAIQRWDLGAMDQLPEYMKACFLPLLNLFNEIEEKLIKEGELYPVHYLKEEMKALVRAYFEEAKWFNARHVPMLNEYLGASLVTSVYPLLTVAAFMGMGTIATRVTYDWVNNGSKILRSSCLVGRLMDDIKSNKSEQKRGHVASSVQCYMKEHGVSEEKACYELWKMVEAAWKDINEECLKKEVPLSLLMRVVNLTRIIEVVYQHGDGYTESSGHTKEQIASLLVNSISI